MTDTTTTHVDWHDIPPGFYAVPVVTDAGLLGHRLFQRRGPFKEGRWRHPEGEWKPWPHSIARPSYQLAEGVTREEFRAAKGSAWDEANIKFVLENLDMCREAFGQVVGRCGCCGRALTDPDSKMRGIGPECIKGMQ
jgi:hypothetical protein